MMGNSQNASGRVLSDTDAALLRELLLNACVALTGSLVRRQRSELGLRCDEQAIRAACETVVRRGFEYNGRSYEQPSLDDVRWVIERFAGIHVVQGVHPSVVAAAIAPAVAAIRAMGVDSR